LEGELLDYKFLNNTYTAHKTSHLRTAQEALSNFFLQRNKIDLVKGKSQ